MEFLQLNRSVNELKSRIYITLKYNDNPDYNKHLSKLLWFVSFPSVSLRLKASLSILGAKLFCILKISFIRHSLL